MTVIEQQYMNVVPAVLKDIARQLKIANELKAIELKDKYPQEINLIDNILENA